jgi:hypothetical protein
MLISKYASLETGRLVTLVDSKFQDLLGQKWQGREGRVAMEFLVKLYGLSVPTTPGVPLVEPIEGPMEFKVCLTFLLSKTADMKFRYCTSIPRRHHSHSP